MNNKYYYPVIFMEEENSISAIVPDMPGCFSQGDSLEEAVEMVKEAIGLMLENIDEKDYPAASKPKDITVEDNSFIMMIEFDKLAYDKKYNNKSVKKTLTIPMWLNALAENNHLNFSQILQDALKRKLAVY